MLVKNVAKRKCRPPALAIELLWTRNAKIFAPNDQPELKNENFGTMQK